MLPLRLPLATTALAFALAACTASYEESATLPEPVYTAEAAPVAAEPSFAPEPPRPTRNRGIARRGVVTAGDIDDTLNLGAFQRFVAGQSRALRLPASNFSAPLMVQLIGSDGRPAPGVRYTLRRPGTSQPFWTGYSEVDGNITVFPSLIGVGRLGQVEVHAIPEGSGPETVQVVGTGGSRTRIGLGFEGGWRPDFLDLVFVVDATGSMGDEIDWLRKELHGMVGAARREAPGVSIRYGLVLYRDQGDAYVVRNYGFTSSQGQMQGWLRATEAGGGGDYPEAAADALRAAANLDWRRGKGERLLFHVADAPPHSRDARAYLEAARAAMMKDVQIFGLGASGVGIESEYLMRQAAAQTQGRYLFLTDDSGVGGSHAEPTISCYRVTNLTSLVTRVLRSELSGRRVEARGGQILREVGSYAGGVCRN